MADRKTIPDKKIINMALPGELVDQINDYRFRYRIESQAEAIRQLLFAAIDHEREEKRDKEALKQWETKFGN